MNICLSLLFLIYSFPLTSFHHNKFISVPSALTLTQSAAIKLSLSFLQRPRSLQCSMSLSNQWLWMRVRSWVSGVMSAGLLLWRSSGWRTGRTWRQPAAQGSASLTGQHVWRSVQPPDTMLAITSAKPPMMLAVSSARPKSPSKVKTYILHWWPHLL